MRLRSRELFGAVRSEGGLLPADLLQRVADGDRTLPGVGADTYRLDPGVRLNERITRAWNRLSAAWRLFDEERRRLGPGEAGGRLTRDRWLHVLFDELGYGRLVAQPAIEIEGKRYPVFSQWQHTPIHLVGCGVPLDRRTAGVAGAAGQSPHSLVQELLNRSPQRLWGMVSNGLALRLLRDNVALTRQAFVEFDLEAVFAGELYADFVVLWLVSQQSRVEGERPEDCWLERWSAEAAQTGTRALEALREGVERAIAALGAGFLAHPTNGELHEALRAGELEAREYYRQLLRLVYRLLFLFVAEDRDALLRPDADRAARERYERFYSTRRLRTLAARRRGGAQHDLFEQLKTVMGRLHEAGEPVLGLPALGSLLWAPGAIGPLGGAQIANADLLDTLRELAFVDEGGVRRAVDFRHLGAEELGSVYESLLELHPELHRETATFTLDTAAGHERKTTGSYYTPASLIAALLDSALEPVLDEAASAEDPEAAILALKVCDPACGSGHFLVAAANRIAKRLAALRSGDPEPAPAEVRHALRDVVGNCLYGVDQNAMAVELCKVSLWLEALEPGRPLSFLDHRIVQGNSLLGATSALVAGGVPDAAFKPLGDDVKSVVVELRKRNARERSGQTAMAFDKVVETDARALRERALAVAAAPDGTLSEVARKAAAHRELQASRELVRQRRSADAWCAAFVAPKRPGEDAVTQATVERMATGAESAAEREMVEVLAGEYGFLHWHVAFPDVFDATGGITATGGAGSHGGFDVVLGNPPWERIKLQEKEFFATRHPEIATAATKALREKLIAALEEGDPALHAEFDAAKRAAEGASHLVRSSGRYPLTGRGDVNTYAIFAETMDILRGTNGRVGCVVPTGIATDATTKGFFGSLMATGLLASLFDFDNSGGIFPGVAPVVRFCLLTIGVRRRQHATFGFHLTDTADLLDGERLFPLTAAEVCKLNPKTGTCPVFRSRREAEISLRAHERFQVLDSEAGDASWDLRITQMFHMANDSQLFRREAGTGDVPLVEAKMIQAYNHRFGTFEGVDGVRSRPSSVKELKSLMYQPLPRYWVSQNEVKRRASVFTPRKWLLVWREAAYPATNQRTLMATVSPLNGVAHTCWIGSLEGDGQKSSAFLSLLNSFVFDFLLRAKMAGAHINKFALQQIAVPSWTNMTDPAPWHSDLSVSEWIAGRVLELSYTDYRLAPFALDLDYAGPPFEWDSDRRALIRAELDAAFFHLYGLEHAETAFVLDTFPILRRKDEQQFDEYRTKRLVMERYEELAEAISVGSRYETSLDPRPGDARAAHLAGRANT